MSSWAEAPGKTANRGWVFWAALAPTLAAIIGFGGVYGYIWAPVDAVLFAALVYLLWSRMLQARTLPGHGLLWPMGAFGLLVLVQGYAGVSQYPGATLSEAVPLAGCGAVFYLMLYACREEEWLPRLGWILWLFCGLLAAETLAQANGANNYIYWFHNASYATPAGPFVYHNFYAGCMDLLLPIAVVVAFRPPPRQQHPGALWLRRALVPALGLASVVVARSRGGVLILLAEACLGAWVFWPELKRSRHGRRNLGLAAVLAAGFSLLANWGPLVRRFGTLANHDASFLDRLHFTAACWRIFLDHPWFGSGFNTFATIYPAYQTLPSGLSVAYAHNDYAQALAETGTVGIVCVMAFLLLWGRAFWQRRRQVDSGDARRVQLGAFIGGTGFLLHSAGDFQFHAPGNALLFFVLTAAAAVPIMRRKRGHQNDARSHHRSGRIRRPPLDTAASAGRP